MVTRDQVEKTIAERLEQFEKGEAVGDAKNRAITMKLGGRKQAQPAAVMSITKEDVDSLKLEMVRELRDMKQQLKETNDANAILFQELKKMNQELIKKIGAEEVKELPVPSAHHDTQLHRSHSVLVNPTRYLEGPQGLVNPSDGGLKEDPAVEGDLRIKLTEEEKTDLSEKVRTLLDCFGEDRG